MVADALSWKAVIMGSLAHLAAEGWLLASDLQSLANRLVWLDVSDSSQVLPFIRALSSLVDRIRAPQFEDKLLMGLRDKVLQGIGGQATVDTDGVLRFDDLLCLPKVGDLIYLIL